MKITKNAVFPRQQNRIETTELSAAFHRVFVSAFITQREWERSRSFFKLKRTKLGCLPALACYLLFTNALINSLFSLAHIHATFMSWLKIYIVRLISKWWKQRNNNLHHKQTTRCVSAHSTATVTCTEFLISSSFFFFGCNVLAWTEKNVCVFSLSWSLSLGA